MPRLRPQDDVDVEPLVALARRAWTDVERTIDEILVIGVDPRARNRGVGGALLDRAVADLREQGAPVIMVETGGDDGHARALYESADFTRLPVAQYWLPGSAAASPQSGSSS
ncbi:MAG TPA: GNAT family N-acetyltransferase [Euzebyales bacterium]